MSDENLKSGRSKGDLLEAALEHIESILLSEDPATAGRPIRIIPKRIINNDGVHHEIDLWVELLSDDGYDSLFIFECKNWTKKVSKNEVIIFEEKVKVSSAQRGFIVAPAFTSDAASQAEKNPRIRLLTTRDLTENELPTIIGTLHGIWCDRFKFSANMEKEVPSSTPFLSLADSVMTVDGIQVDSNLYLLEWGYKALHRSLSGFASSYLSQGAHPYSFSERRTFNDEILEVNGDRMKWVEVKGVGNLMIERGEILAGIEIQGRGRAYKWIGKFPGEDYCVDLAQTHRGMAHEKLSSDTSGFIRIIALPSFSQK